MSVAPRALLYEKGKPLKAAIANTWFYCCPNQKLQSLMISKKRNLAVILDC